VDLLSDPLLFLVLSRSVAYVGVWGREGGVRKLGE